MLKILPPTALLFVAACAPRPASTPIPTKAPSTVPTQPAADQHDHRTLNGMTASELIEHFGRPRLQVQEGDGTKLQFMGVSCVLDFYLYPGQGGAPRVTYMDARNIQGADVSTQSCVYEIERARGVR